uniref:Uncharacterized protein n=1 Tax=Anguilla anguilla TaxID=7936 RepID=A0A0E9P5G4_ANGAN
MSTTWDSDVIARCFTFSFSSHRIFFSITPACVRWSCATMLVNLDKRCAFSSQTPAAVIKNTFEFDYCEELFWFHHPQPLLWSILE